MPFIPHTDNDTKLMLKELGVEKIQDLFDEIPTELLIKECENIPEGLSEMECVRLMEKRANQTALLQCFIGAGAYEHHIPAAVWDITQRGEFLTAYTPYQAEASQGTLQLMWEYQSMMASLMGMEISNASLYDGASALAEAVLMAVRLSTTNHHPTVAIPQSLHPHYRQVLTTILDPQGIDIIEIPFDKAGDLNLKTVKTCTVLVIAQPNVFGRLENVDELTDWAHQHQALVVAVVNPIAMAWLKPPGQWGTKGADIACGEGQPLGVPLAGGGPYFGFLCARQAFVRQMPGRLVGLTQDKDNQPGFTLTLQAREQHIRRGKATSNICTNQGLMVTAATLYMSFLGPVGLARVAKKCYNNMQYLITKLQAIKKIEQVFLGDHFHESLWRLPVKVDVVLERLCAFGIAGGWDLSPYYPECENCLLICVTETKTQEDIDYFVSALEKALSGS